MSIWHWVKEVTVKIFWPWFKEVAWPFIRQHLNDLIFFALDLFKDKFKKWASEQTEKKSENANQKADEFTKKAESAKTHEEAEKFRAIAQVWREVAEQFRQENEALKRKIDELSQEVKEEASDKVESLNIDLDFSSEKPVLSIGNTLYDLPALPSPDDSKKLKR
jgi:hypothetical protein